VTAGSLWLPRGVLIAAETRMSDDEMGRIFQATPWSNGDLSHTRVRYRNEAAKSSGS
jgi:hypothetical protein